DRSSTDQAFDVQKHWHHFPNRVVSLLTPLSIGAKLTSRFGGVGLVGELLQVSNDVFPLLLILEPGKRHLGIWHEGARILEIFEQILLGPNEPLFSSLLVGLGVIETLDCTRGAADDAVELRPDHVLCLFPDLMAGPAFPEYCLALLGV